MADRITIDISILQGIFGDLNKLQQQLVGVSGGAMAVDNAASKGFGGMRTAVTGATTAVNGLDRSVDASMRNIVGDIMAPIAKTQELENKLRTLGDQVRTSKSVREIVALKREITATQRELDRVNPTGMEQKVSGSMSRLRGMFGGLVAPLAGAFAVTGVAAFGKGLLDAAANAQMYESSLNVMLKNKGQVDSLMAQVKTFAADTPFELVEIQEASKGFVAAGFAVDDIIPKLRTIGQTAAALGQPFDEIAAFYRKVKSGGVVQAEELNQMGDRGIPLIKKLAEVMGVAESRIRKMASEGEIGFKEMEAAFERMGGVGGDFDGIFGAAMSSLTGKLSILGDAWGSFKVEMGTALAPAFTAGINLGTRALEGLRGAFQWVMQNGPLVRNVMTVIAAGVGIYSTALLINNAGLIRNNVLQGIAALRTGALAVVTNLVTAATSLWTGAQWLLNAALNANPIGIVVLAIAGLVAGIVWAWNNFEGFRGVVMGVWEVLKSAFNWIAEKAQPIIAALAVYWEVWKISIISTWESIVSFVKSVGEWLNVLWGGVKWFVDMVVDYWSGLAEMLIAPFRTAFEFIAQIPGMDKLIGKAKEVGGKVGEAFGRGQKEGVAGFQADKAKAGIDATMLAKPAQDIGAASLVGGPKSSKDSKANGVTVGGDKGSGRTITMEVTINNNFSVPRDANMGMREAAERLAGQLTNKLNDAQFAMG